MVTWGEERGGGIDWEFGIDMETKKEAVPQFPAQSRRHELLMSLWHLAGYKALSYIIWGLILTYGKLWIINPI